MAEGWLRSLAGDHFEAASAGTKPVGLHPLAIQVMKEVGIDIDHHRSKHIDEFRDQTFEFVITVCDHARATCPFFPAAQNRLHWSFEDPAAIKGSAEERVAGFRRIRDEIGRAIRHWLETQPPVP